MHLPATRSKYIVRHHLFSLQICFNRIGAQIELDILFLVFTPLFLAMLVLFPTYSVPNAVLLNKLMPNYVCFHLIELKINQDPARPELNSGNACDEFLTSNCSAKAQDESVMSLLGRFSAKGL